MTGFEHLADNDPTAPWITDRDYGGMKPASARASWLAGEQRRLSDESFAAFNEDVPPPSCAEDYGLSSDAERILVEDEDAPALVTKTPADWAGTEAKEQPSLVAGRIPGNDLTILAGNGGSGKTEILNQLCVNVSAGLGDWLGAVAEHGTVVFLSCEEPEHDVRNRIERICKHRSVDPHKLTNLHLHFPDLAETWLVSEGKNDKIVETTFFKALEAWIKDYRPVLVGIDSVAAVFDGDAVKRRQVRQFLAKLRKLALDYKVAIVLLDHPSVRGMQDNSGTANSVDWRNSVRSMLLLSDPDKDDPDVRNLTVVKSNRSRAGEKVKLRWNGLTFSTDADAHSSPQRAATERSIEDLFLKLLDKRTAQQRPVRPSTGKGYAPTEFADDPDAQGVNAKAFRSAMERLFNAGTITTASTGPASRRVQHIERSRTA